MYKSGIELPKVAFSTITLSKINSGSFFFGFDLDNSGLLSKIDNLGNITVMEGGTWGTILGTLSNQTDLQAELDAKYDASNPSGYISGITSGNVTAALGYTPYNATNPAGYISGITSGNVTAALGYTPYNSTNPAGYIDATALTAYEPLLGFTPEDTANKSTDGTLAANSDALYASQKAVKTYVDSSVSGLLSDMGNWDASGNVFPTTGGSGPGGSILKGDLWYVSVAGTLGGNAVAVGDNFRALVDNPTLSSDWNILNVGIGFIPENSANKGIANGYASLGATGKVPSAQLPNNIVKLYKTATSAPVSGTLSTMILDSLLIPANTLNVGIAKINLRNVWSTALATKLTRIYINTSNSLVGATLIGTYTAGTGARSIDMARILCIKSATSFEVVAPTATVLASEAQLTALPVNITYNPAVNNYIIVTVKHYNVAESCVNSYISFEIT